MSNNPLVSILINNYNYGRFLSEAIDSALKQSYSNIEVIVVDDGSTDNSQEIIKSYGEKIVPILKQNGGQASAFNAGFAASGGEIICFLDSDDLWKTDKVAEVVNTFVENPDIGWCFHSLEFLSMTPQKISPMIYKGISGKYDLSDHLKRGKLRNKIPEFNLATSGMCFNRALLSKILPMPEVIRITSDDYIKYIALGVSPGFILLEDLALQRIHDNNAYTFRSDKQQLRGKIHALTAYWMKINFATLSKFTNNLLSAGMSIYWSSGGIDPEGHKLINSYLSSATLLEKLEIYTRAFYYRLKP
ncbi:MAG: glycosyltransferase [Symploca sp. SIO1A3]|nr:glycosyltransferase [Symploca sp. SIO1A3]